MAPRGHAVQVKNERGTLVAGGISHDGTQSANIAADCTGLRPDVNRWAEGGWLGLSSASRATVTEKGAEGRTLFATGQHGVRELVPVGKTN